MHTFKYKGKLPGTETVESVLYYAVVVMLAVVFSCCGEVILTAEAPSEMSSSS